MPELVSVGEGARRLGAKPSDITNLFYQRQLRDDLCPVIGGRRVIPVDYLPQILAMLRRRGRRISEPMAGAGEVHHA